jgi:hypothetical protein
MSHLVLPFWKASLSDAINRLRVAHEYLTECAASAAPPKAASDWGTRFKRIAVSLDLPNRPADIGKAQEKLAEVINMAATLERLLGALRWFSLDDRFAAALVAECHPSTSDSIEGNDLILQARAQIEARVEVCDIVSSSTDGNGKEQSSLQKLGWKLDAPSGDVSHWLATSPEFAKYLTKKRRKWLLKPYRYVQLDVGDAANTSLLEIVRADREPCRTTDVGRVRGE